MKCTCFAICLILLISINNNDGSWLPMLDDSSEFATEAPSLEELKVSDPERYQEVLEARPQLRNMEQKLSYNINPDDLERLRLKQEPDLDLSGESSRPLPSNFDDLKITHPKLYQKVVDELRKLDGDYKDYYDQDQDAVNRTTATELRENLNISRRWWGENKIKYADKMASYWFWSWPKYTGSAVQSCYECGHDKGIPRSPLCHDAFESPDWRARTMARYFRTKCYRNTYNDQWSDARKKPYYFDEKVFVGDRGLKKRRYGLKIGGCYKRFLDVGKVYTQRGCRRWPPGPWHSNAEYTSNFAAHRFKKLEYLLGQAHEDRCLYSPHASLTPFHRGISLFARYHVCVCHTDYCNRAWQPSLTVVVFAINIMLIILNKINL